MHYDPILHRSKLRGLLYLLCNPQNLVHIRAQKKSLLTAAVQYVICIHQLARLLTSPTYLAQNSLTLHKDCRERHPGGLPFDWKDALMLRNQFYRWPLSNQTPKLEDGYNTFADVLFGSYDYISSLYSSRFCTNMSPLETWAEKLEAKVLQMSKLLSRARFHRLDLKHARLYTFLVHNLSSQDFIFRHRRISLQEQGLLRGSFEYKSDGSRCTPFQEWVVVVLGLPDKHASQPRSCNWS